MLIPIPFLVTILLGLGLIIYNFIHGDRRKLCDLILIPIIGLALIYVGVRAYVDLKKFEPVSAYAHP